MIFRHHPVFLEELQNFIERHCPGKSTTEQTLMNLQNLIESHFCKRIPCFTNKHLGRAEDFGGYNVYWLHMVIPNSNLSRTQFPKAYFVIYNDFLSFLCLGSHLENYKDAKLHKLAVKRLEEMVTIFSLLSK